MSYDKNRTGLGFLVGVLVGISSCNLVHTKLWNETTNYSSEVLTPEIVVEGEYYIKAPFPGAHEENHWDINNDGWYSWQEDNWVGIGSPELGYESLQRKTSYLPLN